MSWPRVAFRSAVKAKFVGVLVSAVVVVAVVVAVAIFVGGRRSLDRRVVRRLGTDRGRCREFEQT